MDVKVPRTVTLRAVDNLAYYYKYKPNGKHLSFWKFVGADWNSLKRQRSDETEYWILPPDVAERVCNIASPHFRTIIKAMEVNGAKIDLTLHYWA